MEPLPPGFAKQLLQVIEPGGEGAAAEVIGAAIHLDDARLGKFLELLADRVRSSGKPITPLFEHKAVRLCVARDSTLSRFDPLAAALQSMASSTKSPKSRTTTRASGSRLSVFPRCPHYGMYRSRQMTWTTFVYSCLGY